jgi:hypothetical protein
MGLLLRRKGRRCEEVLRTSRVVYIFLAIYARCACRFLELGTSSFDLTCVLALRIRRQSASEIAEWMISLCERALVFIDQKYHHEVENEQFYVPCEG